MASSTLNQFFLIGAEATHHHLYFTPLQITKGRQAVVATDGDDVDALLARLAEDGKKKSIGIIDAKYADC